MVTIGDINFPSVVISPISLYLLFKRRRGYTNLMTSIFRKTPIQVPSAIPCSMHDIKSFAFETPIILFDPIHQGRIVFKSVNSYFSLFKRRSRRLELLLPSSFLWSIDGYFLLFLCINQEHLLNECRIFINPSQSHLELYLLRQRIKKFRCKILFSYSVT